MDFSIQWSFDRAKTAADRIVAGESTKTAKTDTATDMQDLKRRIEALEKEMTDVRSTSPEHE